MHVTFSDVNESLWGGHFKLVLTQYVNLATVSAANVFSFCRAVD